MTSNDATFLRGIFEIDKESYDAEFNEQGIMLKLIGSAGKKKKSGDKAGRKAAAVASFEGILFRDILSVHLHRRQPFTSKSSQSQLNVGSCDGISIASYERKEHNQLKRKQILMQQCTESICATWVNSIQVAIGRKAYGKVKIYVSVTADEEKPSRLALKDTVVPMLNEYNIEYDSEEFQAQDDFKETHLSIDLTIYSAVIIIGGDDAVHFLVNTLLLETLHQAGLIMNSASRVPALPLPLVIVPTGCSNIMARTVYGVEDPETSMIHFLLGHRSSLDIMSLFRQDEFLRFAFHCSYGYAATVLGYLPRYEWMGPVKKFHSAFGKATGKKKLKSYEMEISYIPSDEEPKRERCFANCDHCVAQMRNRNPSCPDEDVIEELDPLAQSGTSSAIIELGQQSAWITMKGNYMDASVFCLPGLWRYSPQGVSPFTHRGDGSADVILVEPVDRRQFVRFLKRHTNGKNPFDFDFVKRVRAKEVRVRMRSSTWNFKDWERNELKELAKKVPTVSADSSDDEGTKKLPSTLSGSPSMPVFVNNLNYYQRLEKKRELKERTSAEKRFGQWNIDMQLSNDQEILFRVHLQLVPVCSCGPFPGFEKEETMSSCIPHWG